MRSMRCKCRACALDWHAPLKTQMASQQRQELPRARPCRHQLVNPPTPLSPPLLLAQVQHELGVVVPAATDKAPAELHPALHPRHALGGLICAVSMMRSAHCIGQLTHGTLPVVMPVVLLVVWWLT